VVLPQAPEDGRNSRPKHVELIEIVNKIIIVASSWLFILLRFLLLCHLLPVSVGVITLAVNYQATRTNHSMTIKRDANEI